MANVCEIPLFNEKEEGIDGILRDYRRVAIVGISRNREKASYEVAKYLKENGYSIFPVNPKYEEILKIKCYSSLLDIPYSIQIVNIFRRPEAVPEIVEDAIKCRAKVIWMQLGIVNNEAARQAKEAGCKVIMDRCIMAEHKRLRAGR